MSTDIFLVQTRSCLGIYFKKHFFNPLFSETKYLWSFYYNMRNLHANMSHFVPRDWNGEYIFVNFLIYQTLLCFISHLYKHQNEKRLLPDCAYSEKKDHFIQLAHWTVNFYLFPYPILPFKIPYINHQSPHLITNCSSFGIARV